MTSKKTAGIDDNPPDPLKRLRQAIDSFRDDLSAADTLVHQPFDPDNPVHVDIEISSILAAVQQLQDDADFSSLLDDLSRWQSEHE